jgi:hypothetical protein
MVAFRTLLADILTFHVMIDAWRQSKDYIAAQHLPKKLIHERNKAGSLPGAECRCHTFYNEVGPQNVEELFGSDLIGQILISTGH